MSKTEKYAIKMEDISKTYISGEIKVEALKNINMKLEMGEILVILGPSGSGKTTLLNLIGGITSPDKGGDLLSIFGKDIKDLAQKDLTEYRRDRVGFIFQFFNLFPSLTAIDNVVIGIDLLKRKTKKDIETYQIAKEYLDQVGLKDRLYHYPSQLSGGEQQRVAIARALAKIPFIGKEFILLCDEPTGDLDTETGNKILKIMKEMNKNIGITILLVTHNLRIAEMVSTKIISLKNGQIAN
jgi:putative ABC transport system ATP-binding protein